MNDGAGHPIHDQVLRTISQRLGASGRADETQVLTPGW
ncbi:MAG: hypothetical protein IPJ38_09395 [Dechloromonas sp.]|uniref:Uncharacterized protein n=1 Tax=Candidatus Dechloromonas phosphorivorans TaxID=2899244 RepID=A0A935K296_9RHOO|nr:hypothetical protein [Candidatus Dechloromonas phosphorivorans]